jgi:ABC-2 type transport system ATP-binding protein
VFLTTQYLEEADVLADRISIIHRGRLVAEGAPQALKDEIGRPTLEVAPRQADRLAAVDGVLAGFGARVRTPTPGATAARLDEGADALAAVVRALDDVGIEISHFRLHAPTLDDVFLAKTGESMADAEDDDVAAPSGEPAGALA